MGLDEQWSPYVLPDRTDLCTDDDLRVAQKIISRVQSHSDYKHLRSLVLAHNFSPGQSSSPAQG